MKYSLTVTLLMLTTALCTTSCKKEFTCICEMGNGDTTNEIIKASSDEDAKSTCTNIGTQRGQVCDIQ